MRATINEIKAVIANIKEMAQQEGSTFGEIASLLQAGATLIGDDRTVALIGIAKRRA